MEKEATLHTRWLNIVDHALPFQNKRHHIAWQNKLRSEVMQINRSLSNMYAEFNAGRDKEGDAWCTEANAHLGLLLDIYSKRESDDWTPPPEAANTVKRTHYYAYPKRKPAETRVDELIAIIRKKLFSIAITIGLSLGLIFGIGYVVQKHVVILLNQIWR